MEQEYYLVIVNTLQKKFIICAEKDEFKNKEYEIYLKFKFSKGDQVQIISNIHQNPNLTFGIKIMLEFIKNIFLNIIKKYKEFKLKKNINFQEDLYSQLKHNKIISYFYNDEWVEIPNVDSVLNKYKT